MPDDPIESDGAWMRDRANRLLDEAFADDPKFREAFLRARPGRQAQILSEALGSGDHDALRRLEIALEKLRGPRNQR